MVAPPVLVIRGCASFVLLLNACSIVAEKGRNSSHVKSEALLRVQADQVLPSGRRDFGVDLQVGREPRKTINEPD